MRRSVREFYDTLADYFHLIFEDWDRSIVRQGDVLAAVISGRWDRTARQVLDAAVGIGTQALGLAARGFEVTGSDLSVAAVARAQQEAANRGLRIPLVAADFRHLPFPPAAFDIVLACDNALPHLLTPGDIRDALSELRRCVRPGGGCLVSMRDYGEPPPAGTVEVRPYGEREYQGRRYHAEQEWRWTGPTYELVLRIRADGDNAAPLIEARTTYFAVPVATVAALMRDAGFTDVQVDDRYYQPLLVGSVPTVPP